MMNVVVTGVRLNMQRGGSALRPHESVSSHSGEKSARATQVYVESIGFGDALKRDARGGETVLRIDETGTL